jgi:hypothetical protein
MFLDCTDSINELATTVTGFIRKCIADAFPTVKVCCFPNPLQPPQSHQTDKRTIWESYYTGSDTRRMWQGLQSISDYKGRPSRDLPNDASLPDELNAFYARFDKNNTKLCKRAPAISLDWVISL